MACPRKRKYASIVEPSEDELNNSIMLNELHQSSGSSHVSHLNDKDIESNMEGEVFHDPVHGHYEVHPLLLSIIDTPQFQRLKYIRQMGGSFYLYMGACHTRFQHSLGVGYLSGRLCRVLQKRQPELQITNKDVLCLQVAGLCHDIGHGPFSHFFDKLFLPSVKPEINWSHEDGSIAMFNHLLNENNLLAVFADYGLDENDITFIKELISGPLDGEDSIQEWPYKGRTVEKSFLYEIVSNKTSGVDVDKWDYLARDSFHLGIPNSFNYRRFLKFARVISCDGRLQICTRDKEIGTLYEMFHVRNKLQRLSCMHKTKLIAELMLRDVFVKANDYIFIPGKDGKMFKIADCIYDMFAYTKLTDQVLFMIQVSNDERLKEAQQLIERIHRRDLYKLVSQRILPRKLHKSEDKLRDEIFEKIYDDVSASKEDFIVNITKFDYGMGDHNPVNHVRFYEKDKPNIGIQIKPEQVSLMLPRVYNEHHIRLISKKNDPFLIQYASISFKRWFESTFCDADSECSSNQQDGHEY